jgi:hypothetical protein
MKYLKMLVVLLLTIFTIGSAAAQIVVKARVGDRGHRHHHYYYRHHHRYDHWY